MVLAPLVALALGQTAPADRSGLPDLVRVMDAAASLKQGTVAFSKWNRPDRDSALQFDYDARWVLSPGQERFSAAGYWGDAIEVWRKGSVAWIDGLMGSPPEKRDLTAGFANLSEFDPGNGYGLVFWQLRRGPSALDRWVKPDAPIVSKPWGSGVEITLQSPVYGRLTLFADASSRLFEARYDEEERLLNLYRQYPGWYNRPNGNLTIERCGY